MCEENEEIDVCDVCGGEYPSLDDVDYGVCPMCTGLEDDI